MEEAVVEEVEGVEAEAEEGSSAEEAAKKSPWSWVKFLTGSQGHGSQAGDVGSTPGSSAEATGGEAGLAQRYQVGTYLRYPFVHLLIASWPCTAEWNSARLRRVMAFAGCYEEPERPRGLLW